MAFPNGTSCCAKSDREDPPVAQDVSDSRRFAAVRLFITPTRVLTPSIELASMLLAPSKKGCSLVIKLDRSSAIGPREEVNPSPMLPMSRPKPYPSFSRRGIPSFMNVSICGNLELSRPSPSKTTAIAEMNTTSEPIPIKAPKPKVPTTPRRTSAADIEIRSADRDFTFSIDPSISRLLM